MSQCNHPECQGYNKCIRGMRKQLRYPIDYKSLYANRIYDNQTANNKCYQNFPINIIEGFGFNKDFFKNISNWILVIIIVCIIGTVFFNNYEEIKLDIPTTDSYATHTIPIKYVIRYN